ncbi:hypothetical protein FRACA_3800003 [Frankia canadensis]|uniref:Uncharacterized protein n=1 Tax=Frankia canadensis TaxID=1836972 RepID=A0A2I2KW20_9ACTN|nr:hypothetical protein [Frankia canadensis]SNQ49855.1 hypothetical protein FRACA_3800003 [Frankia canadensis]SOU57145.1 hypothetical protein FRACA_3800003 [Frankia canadensis]
MTHDIPIVDFARGQRKDEVMHEHLKDFTGTEGVMFIGRAQEKTPLFRTEKRRDTEGKTYPWIVKTTGVVNHFYFYCVDDGFGPFFLKFCSYFPYNAKLCLNGNHWAQRQATKAGIGYVPMDNAFAAVDDPAGLQTICDRLGPDQIDGLLRKWIAILPHPFTPDDRDAGYRYDISVLQAEFSLTQTLDRPLSGRIFFEQVIRDNLDIGRLFLKILTSSAGIDRLRAGRMSESQNIPVPSLRRKKSTISVLFSWRRAAGTLMASIPWDMRRPFIM